jgi:hypothetical protein
MATNVYGQDLTLANNQRISRADPNYDVYAKQLGLSATPAPAPYNANQAPPTSNSNPAITTPEPVAITANPNAPAGWGVDASGHFAKIPAVVDAADLSGNIDFNTGNLQTGSSASTLVAGAQSYQDYRKQMQDALAGVQAPVDEAQVERTGLIEKLKGGMESLLGRSKRTAELTTEAGLPAQQKQLADLNTQIASTKAKYDEINNQIRNSTGLTSTISGSLTRNARDQAVVLGGLSAVAQALQGNISMAKQTIKDTVDLEFEDKQQYVDNLKTQLDLNKDNMTTAEKKKADELTLWLNFKQQEIDQQKSDKKDIYSLAVTAAQNGAPNDIVSAIIQTNDLGSAIQAAGDYMQGAKQYTGDVGEYQYYAQQEQTAGRTPISFADWQSQKKASGQSGIIAEYEYYKKQVEASGGKAVDFNTYQNMDANRKAKATDGRGGSGGSSGTSMTKEEIAFNNDLKKYLALLAADKVSWGEAWNYLKDAYNPPNEVLDSLLNKNRYYNYTGRNASSGRST